MIELLPDEIDRWERSISMVLAYGDAAHAYGDAAHARADRWRRYAVTTFVALVAIWAGFMAYVMTAPVKALIMYAVPMDTTIHCPSEDGGVPGCVWDTWTDGNGQGDPDGPRWLVWP